MVLGQLNLFWHLKYKICVTDIYKTAQLKKPTVYSVVQRNKVFCLLHKKFEEVTGSRDEKQPLAGILSAACTIIQHFYRNMSRSHQHFMNVYGHVRVFICFPGKFLITKRLLPKLTALYFPLQTQAAAIKILIQ